MNLLIRPNGTVECIYGELLDLRCLGEENIRRASHVEPTQHGWYAQIVNGPRLGPYAKRSEAIQAEVTYLLGRLEQTCRTA